MVWLRECMVHVCLIICDPAREGVSQHVFVTVLVNFRLAIT